jgi:hypothetical protein
MRAGFVLGALALGAIAVLAMSGSANAAEPSPGPAPVPSTRGKSVGELAQLAADDVRAHGWSSGRGVVRAFQVAFNAQEASYGKTLSGPAQAPLATDDEWGPQTYAAAAASGVTAPPAAFYSPE